MTLAGCLDSGVRANAQLPSPADDDGFAYSYACPPGKTLERVAGVCIGTLATLTESIQEPFVAINRADPQQIAIGANVGETTAIASADSGVGDVQPYRMNVYVSGDGGETWSRTGFAPIHPQLGGAMVGYSADPALVFDARGVLHVTGILLDAGAVPQYRSLDHLGYRVFHVSTADLGRTWSKTTIVDADDVNDRQWISADPGGALYMTWQRRDPAFRTYSPADITAVAWSLDGGLSWTRQPAEKFVTPCGRPSPMVFLEGAPFFACAGMDDLAFVDLQWYRFDLQTQTSQHISTLENVSASAIIAEVLPDGSIVVAAGGAQIHLARSTDGGRSWTSHRPLSDIAPSFKDERNARLMWMAADDAGRIHVVARTMQSDVPGYDAPNEFQVRHVIVDEDLEFLHERLLTPAGSPVLQRRPPSASPAVADHFFGLAFASDEGFLVWTYDKGLDFTIVKKCSQPRDARPERPRGRPARPTGTGIPARRAADVDPQEGLATAHGGGPRRGPSMCFRGGPVKMA